MRICFYNPQAVHSLMGLTLFASLFQRGSITKNGTKYSCLLELLKDKKIDTAIVVDGTATSLTNSSTKFPFFSQNYFLIKLISYIEVYIWCFLNKINPLNQTMIFNLKNMDKKRDILFSFPFMTDTFIHHNLSNKSIFKNFKGKKTFNLSHYFSRTKIVTDNLRLSGANIAISEANIQSSPYFKKYFDFVTDFWIMPFILREKYVSTTPFASRKNICLAVGTVLAHHPKTPSLQDYFAFFKKYTFHPMRVAINENSKKLSSVIDYSITGGGQNVGQYYSYNIVEKYNQFKMFICPEEEIGLPSVNFIEGMACGCVYLGLKHQMYSDLGLVDGKNYIGYDGTIKDMVSKIKYYQHQNEKLQKISQNGYKLVTSSFTQKKVLETFVDTFQKHYQN